MNYSLIIPIFNEERSIVQLLNQLQKFEDLVDIIIINDGSDDKTKSILMSCLYTFVLEQEFLSYQIEDF